MNLRCLECGSDKIIDLTNEVKDHKAFFLYFKKYIYCPQCDEFKFLRDKKRVDDTAPLAIQQHPPENGAGAMSSNKL
ncbi:MAG: hypothetical protein ACFE9S_06975 [Candidatus Hermodarchaeota archaeon]